MTISAEKAQELLFKPMSKKLCKRNINGIVLLDKPVGMTSNAALQQVKRMLNARKAGHTGSLDPLACGMLPICLGEATKFSQFLLDADKQYLVQAKLGVKTTTGDAEGEVIAEHQVTNISEAEVNNVLAQFIGEIEQIPSMYSALKHNGQPLYKLARQGITIDREPRKIHIKQLSLLSYKKDKLTFEVHCSKGTYVRSLVEDIGDALGVGAHVTYLRRLAVGPYQGSTMVTFDELEQIDPDQDLSKILLPIESSLLSCPKVSLTQSMSFYVRRGQAVMISNLPNEGEWVRLYDNNDAFLGMGQVQTDRKVAPKRLIRARD